MSNENRWTYMKTDAIFEQGQGCHFDTADKCWKRSSLLAHWGMCFVTATAAGGSNFDKAALTHWMRSRGFAHLYTMRMLWWYTWGVQSVANLTDMTRERHNTSFSCSLDSQDRAISHDLGVEVRKVTPAFTLSLWLKAIVKSYLEMTVNTSHTIVLWVI